MVMSEHPSAPIAPITGIAYAHARYPVIQLVGAVGSIRRSQRFLSLDTTETRRNDCAPPCTVGMITKTRNFAMHCKVGITAVTAIGHNS